jgi:hypothetical protein
MAGAVHLHLGFLDVAGHDVLIPEAGPKAFHEFGTDLATGADDEDAFGGHDCRLMGRQM